MSRDRTEKIVFLPRNLHFDSKYLVLSQSLRNFQTSCKDAFSASLKVSEIRIRRAFHELQFSTIISLFFFLHFRKGHAYTFLENKTGCFSIDSKKRWLHVCLFDKRSWSWDFYSVYRLLKKLKKKAQFSFWGQRKAFHYRLFFEEVNLIFFIAERLACSEMQPRQRRFGECGGTLFTL